MSTLNFFILTQEQRDAVIPLGTEMYRINPRLIDAASPGVGININNLAVGYAVGDPVILSGGKYATNYRLVNDPVYQAECPAMVAYLLNLPAALLEIETIFAPQEPI